MRTLARRLSAFTVIITFGAATASPVANALPADTLGPTEHCEEFTDNVLSPYFFSPAVAKLPSEIPGTRVQINSFETLVLGETAVIHREGWCGYHVVAEVTVERRFFPDLHGAVYAEAELYLGADATAPAGRAFWACLEEIDVYSLLLGDRESTRSAYRDAAARALAGHCATSYW